MTEPIASAPEADRNTSADKTLRATLTTTVKAKRPPSALKPLPPRRRSVAPLHPTESARPQCC